MRSGMAVQLNCTRKWHGVILLPVHSLHNGGTNDSYIIVVYVFHLWLCITRYSQSHLAYNVLWNLESMCLKYYSIEFNPLFWNTLPYQVYHSRLSKCTHISHTVAMLACNCQEYEIYNDENTTVHIKMAMKLHGFYNIMVNIQCKLIL